MKATRTEHLTQSFVLHASELENLYSRLKSWLIVFSFETTHKDSFKREFFTLEELLDFQNPPDKDIQKLRIKCYSKESNTSLWLDYSTKQFNNIFISIEGEEKPANAIMQIIEEHISAIRPWYSVLARPTIILVIVSLLFLTLLILTLWGILSGKLSKDDFTHIFTNMLTWGGVIPFLVGVIGGIVEESARLFVFPMGVFAIGQGTKRHNNKELLRTGVVIAFAVSLASSIIVTWLFAL